MARIRTIKPEFWTDEDIALLESDTKLLALGLLNHSDDEGYFKAHEALVKAAVFPFSDHSVNIQGRLKQLQKCSYLSLFTGTDGKQYGHIRNFTNHQKVNRPNPSKIKPLKPITDNSVSDQCALTGGKEQGTGNREQGTGKENPPEIPSVDDGYVFRGDKFNINKSDFENHRKIYPNLNLLAEYAQIDLELRDTAKSKVWMTLNSKLNYRNLKSQPPQKTTASIFNLQNKTYVSGDL